MDAADSKGGSNSDDEGGDKKGENSRRGGSANAPLATSLMGASGGYNQTYIVMKKKGDDGDSKFAADGHEVFFRCGNWCYKGRIQFNGLKISTSDLPVIIPTLQKQQGSLRYFCNANR